MSATITEYRAIFVSPYNRSTSAGPIRKSLDEALQDRPARSEETHEYLAAVETREVPDWKLIPLAELMKYAEEGPSAAPKTV